MGVSPLQKILSPVYLPGQRCQKPLEIIKLLDDYYFPTDDRKWLQVELCSSKRYGHSSPVYLRM